MSSYKCTMFFLLFSLTSLICHAFTYNEKDIILLSNGSTIKQIIINSNSFHLNSVHITNIPSGLFQASYPSIDEYNNIYFQKTYYDKKPNIAFINLTNINIASVTPITDGLMPTISHNGKYLMYKYCKMGTNCSIIIYDTKSNHILSTINDINQIIPNFLWYNDNSIIYYSKNNQTILYNIFTNDKSILNIDSTIIPCELSPDRSMLLCIDKSRKITHIYNIKQNIIEHLFAHKHNTICDSFVWNPNNKGFFYSRQPDFRLKYLLNMNDLFLHGEYRFLYYREIDGKDILIKEHFRLTGGIWIKNNTLNNQ